MMKGPLWAGRHESESKRSFRWLKGGAAATGGSRGCQATAACWPPPPACAPAAPRGTAARPAPQWPGPLRPPGWLRTARRQRQRRGARAPPAPPHRRAASGLRTQVPAAAAARTLRCAARPSRAAAAGWRRRMGRGPAAPRLSQGQPAAATCVQRAGDARRVRVRFAWPGRLPQPPPPPPPPQTLAGTYLMGRGEARAATKRAATPLPSSRAASACSADAPAPPGCMWWNRQQASRTCASSSTASAACTSLHGRAQ